MAKLTLLYIPLGHCCLSTLSALMAELTSVGTKKIGSMWRFPLYTDMRGFDLTTSLCKVIYVSQRDKLIFARETLFLRVQGNFVFSF